MHEVKEYISQSEFCRRLGITRQNLFYAIKRGRVKLEEHNGKNKVEWHEGRRCFINTAREYGRYTSKNITIRNKKMNGEVKQESEEYSQNGKIHPIDLIEEPEDKDGDFRVNMSRVEAEAVKQIYFAKQAKLKFLKTAGILIEVAVVQREWEEIALRVQKAMMSIPDRVAELFASMTDAEKIHSDLTAEISHALSSLQYRVEFEEDKDVRIEELTEE